MWTLLEERLPEDLRTEIEHRINTWVLKKGVDKGRHFDARSKPFFHSSLAHSDLLRRVLHLPWMQSLISSRLTDPVVQHAHPLIKAPGGPPTTFHQDRLFWLELDNPSSMFTVWYAISNVNQRNGCLRMAPGETLREHEKVTTGAGSTWQMVEQPSQTVDIPMERGQALLFDAIQAHGAFANSTSEYRLAMKIVLGERSSIRASRYHNLEEFGKRGPVFRRQASTFINAAKSRIRATLK